MTQDETKVGGGGLPPGDNPPLERFDMDDPPAALMIGPPTEVRGQENERERIQAVYRTIVEIVIYVLLAYFTLLWLGNVGADKFATVAVGPVLTILAGAAGYYFGRKA